MRKVCRGKKNMQKVHVLIRFMWWTWQKVVNHNSGGVLHSMCCSLFSRTQGVFVINLNNFLTSAENIATTVNMRKYWRIHKQKISLMSYLDIERSARTHGCAYRLTFKCSTCTWGLLLVCLVPVMTNPQSVRTKTKRQGGLAVPYFSRWLCVWFSHYDHEQCSTSPLDCKAIWWPLTSDPKLSRP